MLDFCAEGHGFDPQPGQSLFIWIFLLTYYSSITLPRSNERDPNSRAVKMHKSMEKKRRGKEKRKEETIADLSKKRISVRINFSVVTPAP